MSYCDPKVNDYVKWRDIEGWVYFRDSQDHYITIEISAKPKPFCEYTKKRIHFKDHVLVVCQSWYWNELTYVKSRKTVYDDTET